MEFAKILRRFLDEENMTQASFAAQINVKESQISEWLHGKCKPSYDILRTIIKTFNVSAEYWFGLAEL